MAHSDSTRRAAWPEPPIPDDELYFDDGEPMESTRHRAQMDLLVDTLQGFVEARSDVWVAGNAAFHFSALHVRNRDFRAPDVMVVVGVERGERQGWVTWHESSKLPAIIIELLSDSTRDEDLGPKLRTYEWLGIPNYVTFDPFSAELTVRRLGSEQRYAPVAPNAAGRYPLALPLDLALELGTVPGSHDGSPLLWLRWFTPAGHVLPTGWERAEQERARADEEHARRLESEAGLAEALARLAALEKQSPPG